MPVKIGHYELNIIEGNFKQKLIYQQRKLEEFVSVGQSGLFQKLNHNESEPNPKTGGI